MNAEPSGPAPRRGRRWRSFRWLIIFLVVGFVLVSLQRRLIYHPVRETPDAARAERALGSRIVPITVAAADGLPLGGWFVPAGKESSGTTSELAARGPLVVWFHGNGGHRAHRLDQIAILHQLGAGV